MKKLKTIFCIALLSTCLVGNVFAGGTTTGTGYFSFFGEAVDAVVSFFTRECPPRQCGNCKPETTDDGTGNCRPTND